MRRKLFTFCSALSLLLCVAVCMLWVRSRRVADDVQWYRPPHQLPPVGGPGAPGTAVRYWRVGSRTDGVLLALDLLVWQNSALRPLPPSIDRSSGPAAPFRDADATVWRAPVLDVQIAVADYPTGRLRRRRWTVVVPHWLIAAALAVCSASCLFRSAGHRRQAAQGLCRTCGYDLRASSDRCPECGSDINPIPRPAA
jgi:hypothetical protein